MAKQRIEIEVDVPEGWVFTGEYRHVQPNDHYMPEPSSAACWLADDPTDDAYLILRRVEPVRESWWRRVPNPGSDGRCYLYDSLQAANMVRIIPGERIERIDYENGVPVHVALEPAEGEGAKCVACRKPVGVGPLCRDCMSDGSTP